MLSKTSSRPLSRYVPLARCGYDRWGNICRVKYLMNVGCRHGSAKQVTLNFVYTVVAEEQF